MASLPNPLGAVKNFAQAFRASKKGLKPAQFGPVMFRPAPVNVRHLASRPRRWDYSNSGDYRWDLRRYRTGEAPARTIPVISRAERYGGILGKGFRKEKVQLNLFDKVDPRGIDRLRRRQAFREAKEAVRSDVASIPVVRAFLRGRRRHYPLMGDPNPNATRASFAYRLGRVTRGRSRVSDLLPEEDTLWGRLLRGRAPREGSRIRLRADAARQLVAFRSGVHSAAQGNTAIGPTLANRLGRRVGQLPKAYNALAAKANAVAARHFSFPEKVTLKEIIHTPTMSERTGVVSHSRYQMKAARNPVLGFGLDVEQYGRQGNLVGPMDLSLPGRSTLHVNAPMGQRVRNLRQAFYEIRKQHPGVHDWQIEKAIPKSRQVRELEQMVGENAPAMKLRRLRYTRPNKPR